MRKFAERFRLGRVGVEYKDLPTVRAVGKAPRVSARYRTAHITNSEYTCFHVLFLFRRRRAADADTNNLSSGGRS
jgi:hypothetical protein